MMNILSVDQAVELLLQNQIVAAPTETVYGLFGCANSRAAVDNVYRIKNRPADNPLICHFYSLDQILEYVKAPPLYICKLIELVGPGPLTYVLNLKANSPIFLACAGFKTICCRIPDNQLALKLLKKINIPLFGPSANTSTKVSGVTAEMIDRDLGDKIAGIIDGGKATIGLESTIIDTTEFGKIKILRPGAIGKIELETYLAQISFSSIEVLENEKVKNTIPGSKYRHYSPKTMIYLEEKVGSQISFFTKKVARRDEVFTKKIKTTIGFQEFQQNNENYISFGSYQDLVKVSADFYLNLYKLDLQNIETCFFDLESYNRIQNSELSVAKALFNRLEKVLAHN